MSLHVWTGPMFSEKTSHMNRSLGTHLTIVPGTIGIIISPKKDNRSVDEQNPQTSHNPNYYGPPKNIRNIIISETLSDVNVLDVDVIGIDEAHFFPDLKDTVEVWLNDNKHIYVAGLDGTYRMQKFTNIPEISLCFSSISDILHLADSFEKLCAICTICLKDEMKSCSVIQPSNIPKAPFTMRLTSEEGDLVIGGADKYIAVCRKHHKL